jgi:septum formation topological specificity factor MinE
LEDLTLYVAQLRRQILDVTARYTTDHQEHGWQEKASG